MQVIQNALKKPIVRVETDDFDKMEKVSEPSPGSVRKKADILDVGTEIILKGLNSLHYH